MVMNLLALPVLVLVIFGIVFLLVLPLKLAAAAMGAERTGTGWCFLALLCASWVQALGLSFPVYGSLVAFMLAAAVFAGILRTTFLRGIGIAVLHVIFAVILVVIGAALFGVSLTAG